MLLEIAEYKKDVVAAAQIANLFWKTVNTPAHNAIVDAMKATLHALVRKYRAELIAEYGEHSDEDIAESIAADIESAKCNL